MRFLLKPGIKLPHDPAVPLLGIYPEETRTERDTWSPVLPAALRAAGGPGQQPGIKERFAFFDKGQRQAPGRMS